MTWNSMRHVRDSIKIRMMRENRLRYWSLSKSKKVFFICKESLRVMVTLRKVPHNQIRGKLERTLTQSKGMMLGKRIHQLIILQDNISLERNQYKSL